MPMLRLQPAQNRPLTRKIKNVWPSWPSWPPYLKTPTKPPIFQLIQDGQHQTPWPSCPSPLPPTCVPQRPKFIPVSLNNTLATGMSLREARPLCPEFIPVAFNNILSSGCPSWFNFPRRRLRVFAFSCFLIVLPPPASRLLTPVFCLLRLSLPIPFLLSSSGTPSTGFAALCRKASFRLTSKYVQQPPADIQPKSGSAFALSAMRSRGYCGVL